MPVRRRYLAPQVLRDLRRKMVFVSGPRQVGKTTLARSLPGARVGYLNWDVAGETLHHAAAFPPNRCACISARLAKSCTSRAKFGTCTTGTARGRLARNISSKMRKSAMPASKSPRYAGSGGERRDFPTLPCPSTRRAVAGRARPRPRRGRAPRPPRHHLPALAADRPLVAGGRERALGRENAHVGRPQARAGAATQRRELQPPRGRAPPRVLDRQAEARARDAADLPALRRG